MWCRLVSKAARGRRQCSSIVQEGYGSASQVLKKQQGTSLKSLPLQSGQVGVAISSSSLSNIDFYKMSGFSMCPSDRVAGQTGTGLVTAVGAAVSGVALGDSVFVYTAAGTCASHTVAQAEHVVRLKSALSPEMAALVPLVASAHALLVHGARGSGRDRALAAGDVVLADSLSSPLGRAVAAVGARLGLKIAELSAAAPGSRPKAPLVLCSAGGRDNMKALLQAVAPDGVLACVDDSANARGGGFSGFKIPYSAAIFKNVCVAGFDLAAFAETRPGEWRSSVTAAVGLLQSGAVEEAAPQLQVPPAVDLAHVDIGALVERVAKHSVVALKS